MVPTATDGAPDGRGIGLLDRDEAIEHATRVLPSSFREVFVLGVQADPGRRAQEATGDRRAGDAPHALDVVRAHPPRREVGEVTDGQRGSRGDHPRELPLAVQADGHGLTPDRAEEISRADLRNEHGVPAGQERTTTAAFSLVAQIATPWSSPVSRSAMSTS